MIRYNNETHCFEIEIFAKEKSKKEDLVESAMDAIDEILSGKHFCSTIRGAIEQQIRRAYKQGYCDGIDDAPGEDDAKNEGRKEVWDMVRRLYLADEVENAYDLADLQKAFGTVTFSEILLKDVHEVLAKDKERLKRIEEEKIIRPGDEVEISKVWLPDIHRGWVVDIHENTVNVLMNSSHGVEMRYVGIDHCRKTGNTNEHLAQLVKAMKEEEDGAKNS